MNNGNIKFKFFEKRLLHWQKKGDEQLNLRKYYEAITAYNNALITLEHGKRDLAQENIEVSQEDFGMLYNRLGYAYKMTERYKTAITYYHKAVAHDDDPIFSINLLMAYHEIAEYNEAVTVAQTLIQKCLTKLQNNPKNSLELKRYIVKANFLNCIAYVHLAQPNKATDSYHYALLLFSEFSNNDELDELKQAATNILDKVTQKPGHTPTRSIT